MIDRPQTPENSDGAIASKNDKSAGSNIAVSPRSIYVRAPELARDGSLTILLLLARVSVGFMFASGAVNKIASPDWFAATFVEAGLPFAESFSVAIAWIELLVGTTLMFGVFTRISAGVSIGIMAGALVTVVGPPLVNEFATPLTFLSNFFYTPEWLLILIFGFLLLFGSGKFGVDAWLSRAKDSH